MTTQNKSVLLPDYISPINYKLEIKPDLESFTFSGKEIIKIKVEKETNKIIIHSKDLDIETVKYIKGKNEQFASKITYDTKKETAIFYFKNKIKKGAGELSIIFSGIISDSLRGFYKSKYKLGKEDKYLATTQFEATDARRAFPCFDEPAQKAIFDVSLIIPNSHTAISNTLPINIKEHSEGYKVISFSPTPKMSTYLLAFIIGEFEYVEGKTKEGIQVRVFTTAGKKHQAKFALDVGIKSLEFYNEYFDIPYPLPTLDLIAIPDFESGAMENWGAVTFRETALLVDEEHSSLINKQWVALVIAHELAHQWFGNLVTMHWWTDLWLNEGFASYIEYLAVDKIFPNWKVWDQFLISNHNIALELDSLSNSHPIEIEVRCPNEISEIFDMISYSKGASIIRMLAEYIGEDKFKEGLRYYLKKHSYKNTKTINLWQAFEKVSKKPISEIMSSWTKQTGYPIIEISSIKNETIISQDKFFSSRVSKKNTTSNKYLWQIPISYENKKVLINKKKIIIKDIIKNKINKKEISFTRVKYNPYILNKIREEIKENHISTIDKLGVIRDIFALSEGGYIKTSVALDFVLSYKNEKEYIIWAEIMKGLNKISNILKDTETEEKYNRYVLSLLEPVNNMIGFDKKDTDTHSDTLLRSLILSSLVGYGDKKIIKKSLEIFKNRDIKKIDVDLKSIIYNTVIRNGGIREWNIILDMYKKSDLEEERERCMIALTRSADKKIIHKTLDFILNSGEIRDQDVSKMLASIWRNKYAQDITFNFIKKNWKNILKRYGEGGHSLSRILPSLGNHTTLKDLKDAKRFFKKNVAPGAERTLQQAYERIESNAAWLRDDKKDIENWLNGQDKA